jgi:hypothetical protein
MSRKRPAIDKRALGRRIRNKLSGEGYVNLPELEQIAEADLAAAAMPTIGKSTLIGKRAKSIGFTFSMNPLRPPGWFLQVCIYRLLGPTDAFVLTVSEGRGTGDVARAKAGLGNVADGAAIAPFAVRQFAGASLADVRKVLAETWPGQWHWFQEE